MRYQKESDVGEMTTKDTSEAQVRDANNAAK